MTFLTPNFSEWHVQPQKNKYKQNYKKMIRPVTISGSTQWTNTYQIQNSSKSAFVASSCQFTDPDTLRARKLFKIQCVYDHTRVADRTTQLNHICVFLTSISTYKHSKLFCLKLTFSITSVVRHLSAVTRLGLNLSITQTINVAQNKYRTINRSAHNAYTLTITVAIKQI
jgi:hypothetical protein